MPPASPRALVGRLHRAGAAAGDHREAGLDQRPADPDARLVLRRVPRRAGGAEDADRAGPSSASAPKPSTNSDWMRMTRHGSVVHPVGVALGVQQPLVGGAGLHLVAAAQHRSQSLLLQRPQPSAPRALPIDLLPPPSSATVVLTQCRRTAHIVLRLRVRSANVTTGAESPGGSGGEPGAQPLLAVQ